MAGDLGIALGLANAYLKRAVKKGLIKVSQAPAMLRSTAASPSEPSRRSTLGSRFLSVEIGFIAPRTMSGSPVVTPPSRPPARFDARPMPPMRGLSSARTIGS